MIDLRDPAERDAAAAEYVLGTLGAEDHATFAQALARDAELQALVYAWQDHLLGLSTRAAPVSPRAAVWARIERAIEDSAAGTHAARASTALPASPASPAEPAAPSPTGAAATRTRRAPGAAGPPWWQGQRLWQGVSALAVAASVVMAVLLVTRPPPSEGARYLAVLQSPDNQATGWLVELQAGGRLRLVPAGPAGPAPPGRALQFWTKAEGAAAPTSLGLVRAGEVVEMPVSRLPAVGPRQLFEITLEPEGGSPVGRPTGPILYVGRTVAL